MVDPSVDRQERAIAAAGSVAARYGVHGTQPKVLHDSNHTIVHLAPAPVVAKVNTSPSDGSLAGEVKVAQFLTARGAPVVPPSRLVPAGPHVEGGLEITFWKHCPHDEREPSPEELGASLRLFHDAFLAYPEPLRPWNRFDAIERILRSPSALKALAGEDREFLRQRYDELRAAIEPMKYTSRPLHSEPHAGNLLLSANGPRWIDFETACLGPQEWDLTMIPDGVAARHFTGINWDLLRYLRQLRSLCVAVWCWLDPDRAPVLREAGTYHLSLLRASDHM